LIIPLLAYLIYSGCGWRFVEVGIIKKKKNLPDFLAYLVFVNLHVAGIHSIEIDSEREN